MRVTKLIKEYVKEQVELAYVDRINSAREDFANNYKIPAQKIIDECVESFNEQLKEKLSSNGIIITDRYSNGVPLEKLIKFEPYTYGINGLVGSEEVARLCDEKNEKIKEILITLELGGTKAQLDEMLANL